MHTISEALVAASRPLLRRVDAEAAHRLAIRALAAGLVRPRLARDDPALGVQALGQRFPNAIGLAAGFDKDGEAILPLMRLGFGFVEAGTVTPLPQAGNQRPRLYRLEEDRAAINRMGFNNAGVEELCERLATLPARPCPLGANVGINKHGAEPERDYPALVAAVAPYCDYVTINISSPNTPGLRDLQGGARLRAILRAICAGVPVRPPILVKLAPDLSDEGIEEAVAVSVEEGATGLIVGNTTLARPRTLKSRNAVQAGGLSGAPLFERSTEVLLRAARLAQGRLLLIGCGGVQTGADVLAKLRAGATLVQIYTAFAYEGPALIPRLKAELLEALRKDGFATLSDAIGTAL